MINTQPTSEWFRAVAGVGRFNQAYGPMLRFSKTGVVLTAAALRLLPKQEKGAKCAIYFKDRSVAIVPDLDGDFHLGVTMAAGPFKRNGFTESCEVSLGSMNGSPCLVATR